MKAGYWDGFHLAYAFASQYQIRSDKFEPYISVGEFEKYHVFYNYNCNELTACQISFPSKCLYWLLQPLPSELKILNLLGITIRYCLEIRVFLVYDWLGFRNAIFGLSIDLYTITSSHSKNLQQTARYLPQQKLPQKPGNVDLTHRESRTKSSMEYPNFFCNMFTFVFRRGAIYMGPLAF